MDFVRITVETFVGFAALFTITKVLGKTQISQITPFDFISALILGELVGNALFDPDVGVSMILYAIFLWGLLIYCIELITQKYRRTRAFLEGAPSIVIRKGKLQRDVLNKIKLDLNQLMYLLRDKDVFSLREIEYAILETNGSISVLKKHIYQTPDYQFFNATPKPVYLPTTVISDGELIEENIDETEISKEQIINEVEQQGLKVEEVMYAEWDKENGLYIMPI